MKTSLTLHGPDDFSVGRIRITGEGGVVSDRIATPEDIGLQLEDIAPGFYMAQIAPAGVPPQSVVFAVEEGQANSVVLPKFTALTANGAAMTFLDNVSPRAAMEALFGRLAEIEDDEGQQSRSQLFPDPAAMEPASATGSELKQADAVPAQTSSTARRVTLGLAMARPGTRESWVPFPASCVTQASNGMIQLEIRAPEEWDDRLGRRVRLSVAVEGLRTQRLLLPLYRGGTTITLAPASQAASDVVVDVMPSDKALRALWRVLGDGTSEHARAIGARLLQTGDGVDHGAPHRADPWEAALAGLLRLRFPEVLGLPDEQWTKDFVRDCPWMADSHIIRAKQIEFRASKEPTRLGALATETSLLLARAHSCGSPYFSLSNRYFRELADSIAEVENLPAKARNRIRRSQRRWQRELPLQQTSSVSFTWLTRDQNLLKQHGLLAPARRPSGRLSRESQNLIFEGRIEKGSIVIGVPRVDRGIAFGRFDKALIGKEAGEPDSSQALAAPADVPALRRTIISPENPNKGRFGQQPERGGFVLSAEFADRGRHGTMIDAVVTASPEASVEVGDHVWLCLPPPFSPQWIRVLFNGRTARQSIFSCKPFTLGAWLPRQRVELECDVVGPVT